MQHTSLSHFTLQNVLVIGRATCLGNYTLFIDLTFAVLDNCMSNPCKNGGTCSNSDAGYVCSCAIGFVGVNCDGEGRCIVIGFHSNANISRLSCPRLFPATALI